MFTSGNVPYNACWERFSKLTVSLGARTTASSPRVSEPCFPSALFPDECVKSILLSIHYRGYFNIKLSYHTYINRCS